MIPLEAMLVVCHILWFGVRLNQLFFVLACNVDVVDG